MYILPWKVLKKKGMVFRKHKEEILEVILQVAKEDK